MHRLQNFLTHAAELHAFRRLARAPLKITARDQSMVESGETEGAKNTASFHFRGRTQQESTSQQHKQEASRFKVIS